MTLTLLGSHTAARHRSHQMAGCGTLDPMALTASLDKTAYKPGDVMRLTVSDPDRLAAVNVSVQVKTLGHSVSTTAQLLYPITITDDASRVWTLASDSGGVAVYTATA